MRATAAFRREVRRAMKAKGAYEIRNAFPSNGRTILHKSTYPGVAYQVSWLDDDGPVGHAEAQGLDDAIDRVWEDLLTSTKQRFGWKRPTWNPSNVRRIAKL